MKIYYISLVRELMGYCIKVQANNEGVVRDYANNYYGRLWCSVYKEQGDMVIVGQLLNLSNV